MNHRHVALHTFLYCIANMPYAVSKAPQADRNTHSLNVFSSHSHLLQGEGRLCKLKDRTEYLAGKKVGINFIAAFGHGRDRRDSRVGE